MGEEPAVIQQEIAARRERLGDTVGALADKANVPARVSQKLDALHEGSEGRSPKEMLSADGLRHATQGAAGWARQNPLGLAIGAMATGFVIGILLPATAAEDERLGAASDHIKAEVREAGHEALEHTKAAGHEALEHTKAAGHEALEQTKAAGQAALSKGAAPEEPIEGGA